MRRLAAEVLARHAKLDILINNAGAMYTSRQLSADGIELTWALNHLAPFLLTTLLLDRLRASAPSRIITTTSSTATAADEQRQSRTNGTPRSVETRTGMFARTLS